ncbi:unnamed protein product [Gordionus sp. m RMFG-2023]|uniref:uncharacterized protein LOC135929898 isoform X2 n=1 Tax=Gordionus sp. m RMFG-2023 TaxID=3053472 RepID=UPI0030E042B5
MTVTPLHLARILALLLIKAITSNHAELSRFKVADSKGVGESPSRNSNSHAFNHGDDPSGQIDQIPQHLCSSFLPSFKKEPARPNVIVGPRSALNLECRASTKSFDYHPKIYWKFNEEFVGAGLAGKLGIVVKPIGDLLVRTFHKRRNQGAYQCFLATTCGTIAGSKINVTQAELGKAPHFKRIARFTEGQSAVLIPCEAADMHSVPHSIPSVLFTPYAGFPSESATEFTVYGPEENHKRKGYIMLPTGQLILTNVTRADAGTYSCWVTNSMLEKRKKVGRVELKPSSVFDRHRNENENVITVNLTLDLGIFPLASVRMQCFQDWHWSRSPLTAMFSNATIAKVVLPYKTTANGSDLLLSSLLVEETEPKVNGNGNISRQRLLAYYTTMLRIPLIYYECSSRSNNDLVIRYNVLSNLPPVSILSGHPANHNAPFSGEVTDSKDNRGKVISSFDHVIPSTARNIFTHRGVNLSTTDETILPLLTNDAVLSCSIFSSNPLTFDWLLNGHPIKNVQQTSQSSSLLSSLADHSDHITAAIFSLDTRNKPGVYECLASNRLGSIHEVFRISENSYNVNNYMKMDRRGNDQSNVLEKGLSDSLRFRENDHSKDANIVHEKWDYDNLVYEPLKSNVYHKERENVTLDSEFDTGVLNNEIGVNRNLRPKLMAFNPDKPLSIIRSSQVDIASRNSENKDNTSSDEKYSTRHAAFSTSNANLSHIVGQSLGEDKTKVNDRLRPNPLSSLRDPFDLPSESNHLDVETHAKMSKTVGVPSHPKQGVPTLPFQKTRNAHKKLARNSQKLRPFTISGPSSLSLSTGQDLNLNCSALDPFISTQLSHSTNSRMNPSLSFTWLKDGRNVLYNLDELWFSGRINISEGELIYDQNKSVKVYNYTPSDPDVPSSPTENHSFLNEHKNERASGMTIISVLRIADAQKSDAGRYTCIASWNFGNSLGDPSLSMKTLTASAEVKIEEDKNVHSFKNLDSKMGGINNPNRINQIPFLDHQSNINFVTHSTNFYGEKPIQTEALVSPPARTHSEPPPNKSINEIDHNVESENAEEALPDSLISPKAYDDRKTLTEMLSNLGGGGATKVAPEKGAEMVVGKSEEEQEMVVVKSEEEQEMAEKFRKNGKGRNPKRKKLPLDANSDVRIGSMDPVSSENGLKDLTERERMVPPSKPNVTQVTNDSVLVSWDVPANAGLSILFFKIQYRQLQAIDPDWKTQSGQIRSISRSAIVGPLSLGAVYKFRIAAVYQNYDNRHGPNSARFKILKMFKTPILSIANLTSGLDGLKQVKPHPPIIVRVNPVSHYEFEVEWMYQNEREENGLLDSEPSSCVQSDPNKPTNSNESQYQLSKTGFYVYHRPAGSVLTYLRSEPLIIHDDKTSNSVEGNKRNTGKHVYRHRVQVKKRLQSDIDQNDLKGELKGGTYQNISNMIESTTHNDSVVLEISGNDLQNPPLHPMFPDASRFEVRMVTFVSPLCPNLMNASHYESAIKSKLSNPKFVDMSKYVMSNSLLTQRGHRLDVPQPSPPLPHSLTSRRLFFLVLGNAMAFLLILLFASSLACYCKQRKLLEKRKIYRNGGPNLDEYNMTTYKKGWKSIFTFKSSKPASRRFENGGSPVKLHNGKAPLMILDVLRRAEMSAFEFPSEREGGTDDNNLDLKNMQSNNATETTSFNIYNDRNNCSLYNSPLNHYGHKNVDSSPISAEREHLIVQNGVIGGERSFREDYKYQNYQNGYHPFKRNRPNSIVLSIDPTNYTINNNTNFPFTNPNHQIFSTTEHHLSTLPRNRNNNHMTVNNQGVATLNKLSLGYNGTSYKALHRTPIAANSIITSNGEVIDVSNEMNQNWPILNTRLEHMGHNPPLAAPNNRNLFYYDTFGRKRKTSDNKNNGKLMNHPFSSNTYTMVPCHEEEIGGVEERLEDENVDSQLETLGTPIINDQDGIASFDKNRQNRSPLKNSRSVNKRNCNKPNQINRNNKKFKGPNSKTPGSKIYNNPLYANGGDTKYMAGHRSERDMYSLLLSQTYNVNGETKRGYEPNYKNTKQSVLVRARSAKSLVPAFDKNNSYEEDSERNNDETSVPIEDRGSVRSANVNQQSTAYSGPPSGSSFASLPPISATDAYLKDPKIIYGINDDKLTREHGHSHLKNSFDTHHIVNNNNCNNGNGLENVVYGSRFDAIEPISQGIDRKPSLSSFKPNKSPYCVKDHSQFDFERASDTYSKRKSIGQDSAQSNRTSHSSSLLNQNHHHSPNPENNISNFAANYADPHYPNFLNFDLDDLGSNPASHPIPLPPFLISELEDEEETSDAPFGRTKNGGDLNELDALNARYIASYLDFSVTREHLHPQDPPLTMRSFKR